MNLSTLSPLRYPGGKSWLTPTIQNWLTSIPPVTTFVEPFAGGANVGLFVLAQGYVERLILVEKDQQLIDLWDTVLRHSDDLVDKIVSFRPTKTNVTSVLSSTPKDPVGRAFRTLLRNRVARGGVLSETGGLLKRGEKDAGIFSRWYPATLVHRIQCIAALGKQIELRTGDGIETLAELSKDSKAAFLVDPPYSGVGKAAGNRLYSFWEIDHWKLFDVCSTLAGQFLLTYEDTIEVELLSLAHEFNSTRIPMRNSHNNELFELLVSRDLNWISTT